MKHIKYILFFLILTIGVGASAQAIKSPKLRKDIELPMDEKRPKRPHNANKSPRVRVDVEKSKIDSVNNTEAPAPKILTSKKTGKTVDTKEKKSLLSDTVYALQTKKQHGWMEPSAFISPKDKDKYSCIFRFSGRLPNGKFTRMDVIDGYGNYYTDSGIRPYIASQPNDTTVNVAWNQLLNQVCRYEFLPDPTQTTIVQERAYDKDKNIIYTYSTTPIGDNKFIGSYRDSHGRPAEMRIDLDYSYGTLVEITRDRWGNDSIIKFIDSKGALKKNADESYASQYIVDYLGRPLSFRSMDSEGKYMMDNKDNCGVGLRYENKKYPYFPTLTLNLDTDGNPMRTPYQYDNPTCGVAAFSYDYDELGRLKEMAFYDKDLKPCANMFGAHRVVTTYNDHGQRIVEEGFDINGNPSAFVMSLVGKVTSEYDSAGRLISRRFLDKNGNPTKVDGYPCSSIYTFDDDGNMTAVTFYDCRNGKEFVVAYDSIGPGWHKVLSADGIMSIDSLDSKDRIIKSEIYRNGRLTRGINGYATAIIDYYEGLDSESNVLTHYDASGAPCCDNLGVHRKVTQVIDETFHLTTSYTLEGVAVEKYLSEFKDQKMVAQYDANLFGQKCRAGASGGAQYYKAEYLLNNDGNLISYIGRDEFDEPDYIITAKGIFYFCNLGKNEANTYYDEYGRPIEDLATFLQFVKKGVSVEVIDSIAYDKGFRDNDLILKYGDHVNPLPFLEADVRQYYALWALNAALNSAKEHDIIVYRIDEATHEPMIVKISGVKGTLSENGVLTHNRMLTERQADRIVHTVMDHENSVSDPWLTHDEIRADIAIGTFPVVVAFPLPYLANRQLPYPKEVVDPSVLLCAHSLRKGKMWATGEDLKELENLFYNIGTNSETTFYFSKDGINTVTLSCHQDPYAGFYVLAADEPTYKKICKMSDGISKKIKLEKEKRQKIKQENLFGCWTATQQNEWTGIKYDETFEIEFLPDRAVWKYWTPYIQMLDVSSYMVTDIYIEYSTPWELVDGEIRFGEERMDVKWKFDNTRAEGENANRYGSQIGKVKQELSQILTEDDLKKYPVFASRVYGRLYDWLIEELSGDTLKADNNKIKYTLSKERAKK